MASSIPRETTLRGRDLDAEIAARANAAARGASYGLIGRLSGVPPESVRRYLKGRTCIPAWFAARLAECLDVPAEWLLYGEGEGERGSARGSKPNPASRGTPAVHTTGGAEQVAGQPG